MTGKSIARRPALPARQCARLAELTSELAAAAAECRMLLRVHRRDGGSRTGSQPVTAEAMARIAELRRLVDSVEAEVAADTANAAGATGTAGAAS